MELVDCAKDLEFLMPAYLTYKQSTSWETLGWMKHKLESSTQMQIETYKKFEMLYTKMSLLY